MADVPPAIDAEPLNSDELADIRDSVLTQIATGEGLASPAGLNAYAVADLLATIDAQRAWQTSTQPHAFWAAESQSRSDYLDLVLACVRERTTVPTAVPHGTDLVELWVADECVGGWIGPVTRIEGGSPDEATGLWVNGRHVTADEFAAHLKGRRR